MPYELVHTVKHEDKEDENTVLESGEDLNALQSIGASFAISKGIKKDGVSWVHTAAKNPWKYSFHFSDSEFLTITDISR